MVHVETRVCCIEGCDNTNIAAREMCWKHYQRWNRYGDEAFERKWPVRRKACSLPGCERPHNAKGYCHMHYRRWLRWGDPLYTMPRLWDGTLEGLLEKTERDGECMIWTRAIHPSGFPVVRGGEGNAQVYVHRAVWELSHGKIESGVQITRTCGNRACINPDHLKIK